MAEEMMPLIATLPGTDKFSRSLFDDFFEKIDEEYQSVQREELKRLDLLMSWLADQTSLQLALEQVGQHAGTFRSCQYRFPSQQPVAAELRHPGP